MARRSRLLAVLALAAVAALTAPAHASAHDETCLETPEPDPTPSASQSASPDPDPSVAASPAPTAAPSATPSPPKLAVMHDPVTFDLDDGTARAVVFVRNNGGDATARVRVFIAGCTEPVTTAVKPLRAGVGEPVEATFRFAKGMKRSGRIVVDSDPARGGELGGAAFTVAKDEPDGTMLALAGFGSAAAALLLLITRWRSIKSRKKLSDGLEGIDSKWSFKESWASNLTAFGAIFATVIASTGFAGDYLGDFSTSRFVALMLFWTGLAFLAPVAFSAWTKERNAATGTDDVVLATGGGLLLGAFFTMTAVLGQLATLAVLVLHTGFGPEPKAGVVALLLVAAGIVCRYVWQGVHHAVVDIPDAVVKGKQKTETAEQTLLRSVTPGTRVLIVQAVASKQSGIF